MSGTDGNSGQRNGLSHGQRALFTFLGYSLVGSFLAGLATFAALILARPLHLDALIPDGMPNAGAAAIGAFIWSAIPASVAGAALALVVLRNGGFAWITAAAAGGIAFMLAAIVVPLPEGLALTPLTALAAFIAIGVQRLLISARIIE